MNLIDHVRDVPDFPKPGILFRDLTPLFGHPEALREAVERMAAPWRSEGITKVAGVEARGFIVGAAVAGAAFLVELTALSGCERLRGLRVESLLKIP